MVHSQQPYAGAIPIDSEDPDFDWPDLDPTPPPAPKQAASASDALDADADDLDLPEYEPEIAAQAPPEKDIELPEVDGVNEVDGDDPLAPQPVAEAAPSPAPAPAPASASPGLNDDDDLLYWPDEEPPEPEPEEQVQPKPRIVYGPPPPPGPPRYNLIAIDLDGTLLRTDKKLSTFDVKSIREAARRGVKIVLATARPPRSSRYIHEMLGLDTLMVNYNGALIHDRLADEHIRHHPLPRDIGRAIIERAREIEPKVVVSIEVLDKWYTDHDDPNHQTETARKFKPDFIGSLDIPLQFDLTKLMLLAYPQQLKRIARKLEKQFDGQAVFLRSDEAVLQIAHPEVDKGVAVAWVAEQYGVPAAKCMAIGDAPNDAGMLRWAGLGCAMANAFGEARDAADVIVESNDHEGVGQAIEDYVL